MARMPASAHKPLPVDDGVVLTQYGRKMLGEPEFFDRLKPGQLEMSLLWGRVDADTAAMRIARRKAPGRSVRHTTAGRLRSAGFTVVNTPSNGDALHLSVYPPTDSEGNPTEWGDDLAMAFVECFTDAEGA